MRANFFHLYLDVAWYGVLAGSAISFAPIYAARLGAAAWQIGLLTAGPAIVNLLMTLPAGRWLEHRHLGSAVFRTSVVHRLGYLFWIVLPWLAHPISEVWALIAIMLCMAIPGVYLAVAFNGFYADAVPIEWRAKVTGTRNALLAITITVTSLICGWLLDVLTFPIGYQVTFAIGFAGAMLSSYHLWRVRLPVATQPERDFTQPIRDLARPGRMRAGEAPRLSLGLRIFSRARGRSLLQLSVLRGPFLSFLVSLWIFNLSVHLPIAMYPLRWVNEVRLSDGEISFGTALFYGIWTIASTQLAKLNRRWGDRRITIAGALGLSLYPALAALSTGLPGYLLTSLVGGISAALTNGAMVNWLLVRIPSDARMAGLAWYNLSLNAAILLGALVGPWLAVAFGLSTALWLSSAIRLLAALNLMRSH
jgi:MFS family permease